MTPRSVAESEATPAPDILLLGAEWPTRALLRAQLAEEGYDVVAVDGWPVPRRYFRRGLKPRAAIVDLHELPAPNTVLAEIPALASPDRVIVITGLGAISPEELRSQGFHVVARPVTIAEIVAAAARVLKAGGQTRLR